MVANKPASCCASDLYRVKDSMMKRRAEYDVKMVMKLSDLLFGVPSEALGSANENSRNQADNDITAKHPCKSGVASNGVHEKQP
jgi:hypothetical protein